MLRCLFLFCFILAIACHDKEPQTIESIEPIGSVELEMPSLATSTNFSRYFLRNNQTFQFHDYPNPTTHFISLEQRDLLESYKLPNSQSIDCLPFGLLHLSLDSVIAICEGNKIFRCNRDTCIESPIKRSYTNNDYGGQVAWLHNLMPFIHDNRIYARYWSPKQNGSKFFAELMNEGDSLRMNLFGEFPKSMKKDDFHASAGDLTIGASRELVATFKASHEAFIYEGSELAKKVQLPKSEFWKEPEPFNTDSIYSAPYIYKYYSENFLYNSMEYDPFRNQYLRVLSHPNYNADSVKYRDWSILILDQGFDLVREIKMDGSKHRRELFPSEQGVLIPRASNTEDKPQVFDVFDFNQEL